jgi:hypothetical protein
MGFSPNQVGLPGERITAKFGTHRGNCFHKGLDISSSRTPKAFTAGVYGRIIPPIGGPWGTVSVLPSNPFLDRSKGPICYGGIAATCHRGRRSSYLSLREGGSFLNAHARHFTVSACTASREAQYSERDDVLRRKSNLRGSEAKSDPRAQWDEWHHVLTERV